MYRAMVTIRLSPTQLAKLETLKRATRRNASQVLRLLIETASVPEGPDVQASKEVRYHDEI